MNIRTKVLLAETIEFPVIGLALFLSAGTIAWAAGWVFLILFVSFSVSLTLWLLRHDPGLLQERMGLFKSGQKAWDKVFIVMVTVLFVGWLVLMPLDAVRFRWSQMPVWLQALGAILLVCSFYIFYLAYRENPYLSPAVRIQAERGQRVISTGPYRYVRHPTYAGAILLFLGTALLLGSWYGLLLGLVFVVLFAGRAVMEERVLREGLEGYETYMAQVKYRFVPHVW